MSRSRLHAAVARVTGDALTTINRLGFNLDLGADKPRPIHDDPLTMLDCPCCGNPIVLASDNKTPLPRFAECTRCDSVVSYSARETYQTDIDDVTIPPEREFMPAAA